MKTTQDVKNAFYHLIFNANYLNRDENIHGNLNVNEDRPLLGGLPTVSRKVKIGAITCFAVSMVTATTAVIVYYTTKKSDHQPDVTTPDIPIPPTGTPNLSFEFKAPEKGAGSLIISNSGDGDAEIISIEFTTNAVINTRPHGNLAPQGAQIQSVNESGNFITYKLTEPAHPVILKANSNGTLGYSFETAKGSLNIGALPQNITLNTPDATYLVPLTNQCSGDACNNPFPNFRVGGSYNENDNLRQFSVADINPRKLNQIYYAPLICDANGNIGLGNEVIASAQFPSLMALQQGYPYMRISLSINGSTPDAWSALATSPSARTAFSNNILGILEQYNFTGVDINWRPKQADGNNMVFLFQNIRQTLNQSGKQYDLSFSGPSNPADINLLGYRLRDAVSYVDQFNINAYNYNSLLSDYQSPMNLPTNDPNGFTKSVNSSISLYQHYLVPNNKISLGITSSYTGNNVATMNNDGIWQTITGTPNGQFEPGVFDYACVMTNNCYGGNPFPSNCQIISEQQAPFGQYAMTPLAICPENSSVFSGESVSSVTTKTGSALNLQLKGVSLSLGGDIHNNDNLSLLTAINEKILTGTATDNNNYQRLPESTITNEQEWQAFTQTLQGSLASSFLGGIGYSVFFALIDKLTDAILAKILPKDENSLMQDSNLYYLLKTIVYTTTLYVIGSPVLPALGGKLLGDYLIKLLDLKGVDSMTAGSLTSFLVNLKSTPELHSPLGIAYSAMTCLASFCGGLTVFAMQTKKISSHTDTLYQSARKWYQNMGLFATTTGTDESSRNASDVEIEQNCTV
ncbi:MAG: glycoside hydrolase family 18 protein [Gammaproteobacteria bacterium]|nr:glycoside hydrolase family 18 protein [Gammaproteobacteria bacterium]